MPSFQVLLTYLRLQEFASPITSLRCGKEPASFNPPTVDQFEPFPLFYPFCSPHNYTTKKASENAVSEADLTSDRYPSWASKRNHKYYTLLPDKSQSSQTCYLQPIRPTPVPPASTGPPAAAQKLHFHAKLGRLRNFSFLTREIPVYNTHLISRFNPGKEGITAPLIEHIGRVLDPHLPKKNLAVKELVMKALFTVGDF